AHLPLEMQKAIDRPANGDQKQTDIHKDRHPERNIIPPFKPARVLPRPHARLRKCRAREGAWCAIDRGRRFCPEKAKERRREPAEGFDRGLRSFHDLELWSDELRQLRDGPCYAAQRGLQLRIGTGNASAATVGKRGLLSPVC